MRLKTLLLFLFLIQVLIAWSQTDTAQITNDSVQHNPFSNIKQKGNDTFAHRPLELYYKNPAKKTLLTKNSFIGITLLLKDTVSEKVNYSECASGEYINSDGDSIWMALQSTRTSYFDSSGNYTVTSLSYGYNSGQLSTELKSYSYKDIAYVSYHKPFILKINGAAELLANGSMFTALAVAPLVSMDFRGGFNAHRYFRVAGWSLVSYATCVTIFLSTNVRHYKIVNH